MLVVEDEPVLLKLTTRVLQKLGYGTLAAHTPREALRVAREHAGEIHLLLSDVVMPKMNGPDLVRRVRIERPTMRCLLMSGYTADVLGHDATAEAGIAFIQKPFTIEDLSRKIQETLNAP